MSAPELIATAPPASAKARHLPGEAGIWVFVLGDMVIFALFFAVFTFYRGENVQMFLDSQAKLNQNYAVINTIFLLTSSWFVVMALHAVRHNLVRYVRPLIGLAWLCGLGFGVVKIIEYSEKISHGITLTTNDFFMYYYVFTGIHFMHLLIGMAVLTFLWFKARKPSFDAHDVIVYESGATFWHMVDLLWIVLFPLLYLMK